MLAGDLEAAEAELRRDYDTFERMGETNYISTTAALLAEVLYRQGDLDGAEEYTRISEELAAQDDVSSQFRWRSVRAKILATRGRRSRSREARPGGRGEVIRPSDDLNSQGEALIDLAEVLRLAGRPAEAAEAARDALALFEAKGNTVVGRDRASHGAGALVGRRQLTTIRPHIPVQTPFETRPWIVQK